MLFRSRLLSDGQYRHTPAGPRSQAAQRTQLLLRELLRSNFQDLKTLLELPENGELQAYVDIAHRIKGAARIVGAQSLINDCEALEQASPANLLQARDRVQVSIRALGQALTLQLESLTNNS